MKNKHAQALGKLGKRDKYRAKLSEEEKALDYLIELAGMFPKEEKLDVLRKAMDFCRDDKKRAAKELGKLGGSKKTPAKSEASRLNGKKGGRPRTKDKERTTNAT